MGGGRSRTVGPDRPDGFDGHGGARRHHRAVGSVGQRQDVRPAFPARACGSGGRLYPDRWRAPAAAPLARRVDRLDRPEALGAGSLGAGKPGPCRTGSGRRHAAGCPRRRRLRFPVGSRRARLPDRPGRTGPVGRRTATARPGTAIAGEARLLLLDEPTAHLDAEREAAFLHRLRTLASGRTVIVASHHPEVRAVADRVVDLGADA